MKFIMTFLSVIILSIFTFTSTQASAITSKSYMPSKSYDYTYKAYSTKGKLTGTDTLKYIKSGSKKGFWRSVGDDYYTTYEYVSYDKSLWQYSSNAMAMQTGYGIYSNFMIPGKLKKGIKGSEDLGMDGTLKYKVLSTNATVKASGKTYKNTIKMWYSGNKISYYGKNRGLIKTQVLHEGEYKTVYILTKVKSN